MRFSLTILGSSSALPTSNRFLTAQVLNVNERFFLIDCGEGTQIQLRKFKIPFTKINHVFISHLHGDHVFGLPGLVSTFSLLGRENDLHIYAHKSLKQILNQFLGQFNTSLSFNLIYHSLDEERQALVYEDRTIEVFSFPLSHRIPCCGLLFKEKPKMRNIKKDAIAEFNIPVREMVNIKKGADFIADDGTVVPNKQITVASSKSKTFAFVTDTKIMPDLSNILEKVDLLYHEATFLHEDAELAKDTFHSTPVQAAELAAKAAVSRLVIGHFSTRYKNTHMFLDQAASIFPNVELAEDGKIIEI